MILQNIPMRWILRTFAATRGTWLYRSNYTGRVLGMVEGPIWIN